MSNFRIIPKIEVKQFNLVKGYKLEGLRVLGDPLLFIKEYQKALADEILIEDVMASILDTLIKKKLIMDVVSNTSIPLTAGGGIKNIKDADKIFAAGAERLVLCTSAVKNPNIIKQISEKYGSQSLAIKLEIYSEKNKVKYFTFHNGREVHKCDIYDWIDNLIDLGTGEFHINFISDDGTGKALNTKLFSELRKKINIPIIYSGGVSSLEDVKLIRDIGGDGVAIASSLHYEIFYNIKLLKNTDSYFYRKNLNDDVGNYEWALNGYGNDFLPLAPTLSIMDIKKYIKNGRNI